MSDRRPLRLAVSGTYSTGKSTLTEALSLATGIPRTHAMTSREILAEINPDKTVMELDAVELIALGLRRYEERLQNETGRAAFISNGSLIHEWVYGQARYLTGINPGAGPFLRAVKRTAGIRTRRSYRTYLEVYGELVRSRAIQFYDAFVHLPVEFDLHDDGHRPVSEPFRVLSDRLLQETVAATGLPMLVVSGPVRDRLEAVIDHYSLPQVMAIDAAVSQARDRVRRDHDELTADARRRAQQRGTSWTRRLRYAARY
ncbi:AAA family ATPase [Gordonia iterans]